MLSEENQHGGNLGINYPYRRIQHLIVLHFSWAIYKEQVRPAHNSQGALIHQVLTLQPPHNWSPALSTCTECLAFRSWQLYNKSPLYVHNIWQNFQIFTAPYKFTIFSYTYTLRSAFEIRHFFCVAKSATHFSFCVALPKFCVALFFIRNVK